MSQPLKVGHRVEAQGEVYYTFPEDHPMHEAGGWLAVHPGDKGTVCWPGEKDGKITVWWDGVVLPRPIVPAEPVQLKRIPKTRTKAVHR